jgi:hypothetical protein
MTGPLAVYADAFRGELTGRGYIALSTVNEDHEPQHRRGDRLEVPSILFPVGFDEGRCDVIAEASRTRRPKRLSALGLAGCAVLGLGYQEPDHRRGRARRVAFEQP